MKLIGDFHIHSRYARACSKNIDIPTLEKYAKLKGIHVLGTGDFQHPLWGKELKRELTQQENGTLTTKTGYPFILQTEISLMYSQGGKGRRVHLVMLAPNMEVADQVTEALGRRGRLDYDGRPIFGFSCIELVDLMREISPHIEIIPAHAWTPWFSVFGSKSGFSTLQECFQERTKHIHAIETGLSSDPPMNWRLSHLDNINLVSFSDMHSFWPHRMGREVTVFDLDELTYAGILNAIRTGEGLSETIEVDPAYGKYHWDGHRNCNVVMSPKEAEAHHNRCPVCKQELTIGVEHRVEELADREPGFKRENRKPFRHLIPLTEIIAFARGGQVFSKKVLALYHDMIKTFGNEFAVLLQADRSRIAEVSDAALAKHIIDIREGKITVQPGYDGVYGQIQDGNLTPTPVPKKGGQKMLSEFTETSPSPGL